MNQTEMDLYRLFHFNEVSSYMATMHKIDDESIILDNFEVEFKYNKLNLRNTDVPIKYGNIDISFYRDDLRRRDEPIVPAVMDINFSVEGKNIILVDDVLYTGRSVRSAIDAVMTFGRPKSIELLTLINRRFSRHLPIQPNYVGRTIDVLESEKVIVEWKEVVGRDRVLIVNKNNG